MDLRVNYNEVRSIGNQTITKAEEFRSLLNKINNINGQVASAWQGSDAIKYSQAVEMQANNMNQLAAVINQIGDYLIKVGNAYESAKDANANAIRF